MNRKDFFKKALGIGAISLIAPSLIKEKEEHWLEMTGEEWTIKDVELTSYENELNEIENKSKELDGTEVIVYMGNKPIGKCIIEVKFDRL